MTSKTFTYNKTESVTVKWTYNNRDSVTVTGAKNPAQAWDAAEDFLAEASDDKTTYSTGLPSADGIEPTECGTYIFRVKCYEQ